MRFTQHTAHKAAEQIAAGTPLAEIDETELSSLVALCEAELQDREYRNPAQTQIWTHADEAFREMF